MAGISQSGFRPHEEGAEDAGELRRAQPLRPAAHGARRLQLLCGRPRPADQSYVPLITLIPVILSGGAGTRLWPLSRELYPKQLLALVGQRTMLQDTAARLAGIAGSAAPIIVCNEAHR